MGVEPVTIYLMKKFLIGVAATILAAFTAAASNPPRYVFYFIGDGMGLGHVASAQAYNRDVLKNKQPLLMLQFPVAGVCSTYSASSPVTDSAAAGTALSTGLKTRNGMLGVTPDSLPASSIASELFNLGWGIGILTSVAPDDATPAAFYAHQPARQMFYEIGLDAARSGYDFIAGSNLRGTKDSAGKPTSLLDEMKRNGVDVVRGLEPLRQSSSRRVLLLNTDSLNTNDIGYTIDSIPGVLTLPEMTRACLDHLQNNGHDRFFMMVEGGNIDHAAHANDGGAVIKEILNFNQAIAVAYDFYLLHPDETLIIITADHDTGGMALGNSFLKYDANTRVYDHQRISKDSFSAECKAILKSRRVFTWSDMQQLLAEKLGFWNTLALTDSETSSLHDAFVDTFQRHRAADEKTLYNSFNAFAVKVFKILNDHAGVGFTTASHAGNFVPVYAIGVGAERFNGLNDNTDIPAKIRAITAITN